MILLTHADNLLRARWNLIYYQQMPEAFHMQQQIPRIAQGNWEFDVACMFMDNKAWIMEGLRTK